MLTKTSYVVPLRIQELCSPHVKTFSLIFIGSHQAILCVPFYVCLQTKRSNLSKDAFYPFMSGRLIAIGG